MNAEKDTAALARPKAPAGAGPAGGSLTGLLAAFFAFLIWGFLPIFWKALSSVDVFEVLCHRIVWSFLLLLPFMFFRGRFGELRVFLRSPANFAGLLCTGLLLAGNWYLYIWAIASGMVLEASLGYYINPFVNILFGILFFKETISRVVRIAIVIAAAGVLYQMFSLGRPPLVPLALAVSFGIYGLLRKKLLIPALSGLFVETMVVLPVAAGWLLWQAKLGNSAFFRGDLGIDALLVSAGFITTIPLILFAYGARLIRMTSLGLLQYLTPSIVFLLGVFLYQEPFNLDRLITFACIWVSLSLYTWDTARQRRW